MKIIHSNPVLVTKTEELCEFDSSKFRAVKVKFPTLNDNQVLVLQLEDGTILTFANHNILNGICDDCQDTISLYKKEIVQYQIITFEKE